MMFLDSTIIKGFDLFNS